MEWREIEMLRRIAIVNQMTARIQATVAGMQAENEDYKARSFDGTGVAHGEGGFVAAVRQIEADFAYAMNHRDVSNFLHWQDID